MSDNTHKPPTLLVVKNSEPLASSPEPGDPVQPARCNKHPLTRLQRAALADSALCSLNLLHLAGAIQTPVYNSIREELTLHSGDNFDQGA